MPPQRITIAPSPTLARGLCLAHIAAAGAIWFAALPLWPTSVLLAAIGAGLAWSLVSRAALRSPSAIVALEITQAGRISLLTRRGTWHASKLLGTSYVSPGLTVLNLEADGYRLARHVVLLADNVDARDFRRLRIWLRWTSHHLSDVTAGSGDQVFR